MKDTAPLVEAARGGDLEAFEKIVRRFQDMAHGYAWTLVGDFHLAQDMAQESFIEAFRRLPDLRDPRAFPGWFRRIVATRCGTHLRKSEVPLASMEEASTVPAPSPAPAEVTQRREIHERVLEAVRKLPEHHRQVTTLFYINGYSQGEIADFLEVPVTTVKKRLHDSRGKLKERMLDMVEETLKQNAPDERFSRRVIAGLLARPKPLEIPGHPIHEAVAAIRAALPDYEWIQGDEVIEEASAWMWDELKKQAYHLDKGRILRGTTTDAGFQAMRGRKPPVRLINAGRAFRHCSEDSRHLRVFNQLDLICIESGANREALIETVQTTIRAVLGPTDIKWSEERIDGWEDCLDFYVPGIDEEWTGLVGSGLMPETRLREAGFDPEQVSGFGFGMGLENLVAVKLGLKDLRRLWQAPYIPVEEAS